MVILVITDAVNDIIVDKDQSLFFMFLVLLSSFTNFAFNVKRDGTDSLIPC